MRPRPTEQRQVNNEDANPSTFVVSPKSTNLASLQVQISNSYTSPVLNNSRCCLANETPLPSSQPLTRTIHGSGPQM
jgi:hypothetical protein